MLWLDFLGSAAPHLLPVWGHPILAGAAAALGTLNLVFWNHQQVQSAYFTVAIVWLASRSVELVIHDYGYHGWRQADAVARNVVLAFLLYRLWVRRAAEGR